LRIIVLSVAFFILNACQVSPVSGPPPAAVATNSALQGQYALASVEAEQIAATAAVIQATETVAQANRATAESLSAQQTVNAIYAQGTREAISLMATATAVAQVAQLERDLSALEADRLRQQTEAARQSSQTRQIITLTAVITLSVLILLTVIFVYLNLFYYGRPVPKAAAGNGGSMVFELPAETAKHNYLPSFGGARLLPAGSRQAGGTPLPAKLPYGKIGLGRTPNRELWYEPETLGDIQIAGEKGMGKSNMLRLLAYQMFVQQWQLFVIDPEELTFAPTLWGDVANMDTAGLTLAAVEHEIHRRFDLFRELDAGLGTTINDLAAYNRNAPAQLRPMALIIDEANLVFGDRSLVESLGNILVRSRKPGLRVVVAAHLWHSSLVSAMVRYNFGRAVVFKTNSRTSRMLLGSDADAALLPNKPGLALMNEGGKVGMFQSYLLDGQRLETIRTSGRKPVIIDNPGWSDTTEIENDRELEDAERLRVTGPYQSLSAAGHFLTGYANQYSKNRAAQALQHVDEVWAINLLAREGNGQET
jgi:hypothetical protein